MRRRLIVWGMLVGVVALAGCYKVETFWSPDGKSIACLVEKGVRLYDAATMESRLLDTGEGRVLSAAWSPDGQRLAFYAATLGEKAGVSLRVIEPATGKVDTLVLDVWPLPKEPETVEEDESAAHALREIQEEEVVTFEYLAWLSWSPDGTRVAYVGASEEDAGVFLLTYPAEAIQAVPRGEQVGMQAAPAWSPDGKRLAYAVVVSTGTASDEESEPTAADSVWLYDVAAGESVKVCDVPSTTLAEGSPLQWSADGSTIGFIAMGSEGEGIACLVEARGGAPAREAVTGLPAAVAWSPGLDAVAYVGEAGETGEAPVLYRSVGAESPVELGTLALPGEEEPGEADLFRDLGLLTAPPHSLPRFSPDGSRVALRVTEKSDEIKVMVFEVK